MGSLGEITSGSTEIPQHQNYLMINAGMENAEKGGGWLGQRTFFFNFWRPTRTIFAPFPAE